MSSPSKNHPAAGLPDAPAAPAPPPKPADDPAPKEGTKEGNATTIPPGELS